MDTVLSLYVSGDFMGRDKRYVPMGAAAESASGRARQRSQPPEANSKAYTVHVLASPPSPRGSARLTSSFLRTSRPSFAGRLSMSRKAWNRPSRGAHSAHKRCSRATSDTAVCSSGVRVGHRVWQWSPWRKERTSPSDLRRPDQRSERILVLFEERKYPRHRQMDNRDSAARLL
jgi:hypothetical protein